MKIDISKEEESYIKGIDGFRKLSLSIPSLCISLASACIAFEIYYLKHIYTVMPGGNLNDVVAVIPIIVGAILLVAAATSVDWFFDSLSPQELAALNAMHRNRDGDDFKAFTDDNNGFATRLRIFSGGYFLFCISIGVMLFVLTASIPLFLDKDLPQYLLRALIILFSLYYSFLLVVKMLTTNIPIKIWRILVYGASVVTVVYIIIIMVLLDIFVK